LILNRQKENDLKKASFAITPAVTPPPSRTILALDLGTRTGWAVLPRSGRIASGVTEFRPGRNRDRCCDPVPIQERPIIDRAMGAGMAFLRFEKFLADLNRDAGPFDAVVFEEVRAHAGTLAAQVYGGFLAHLTAWCERKAAPFLGAPVATIKRHATGKGNAPKEDVIRAVRAQGFLPKDDNEADALALLAWAIANDIGGAQ
jgi:crossover junction endodeoxyribonuclease RuvC